MNKIQSLVIFLIIVILISPAYKETEERRINKMIENNELTFDVVRVTMYAADPKQTDSTPLLTASGYKIDSLNPEKDRIIAVSRDLKRKYKFGSRVMVKGTGKWDGIYTIQDIMHSRWRNRIDILVNPKDGYGSFKGIRMYKIEEEIAP